MSLTGLSPEQITSLGDLGMKQQDLMLRAATALAQKQESAATREAQFRTIGVSLDGKDYDIDARDFPSMWEKIQTSNRANDTELFTMYDGKQVKIPRDQISNFLNAQANMLQLPSQIANQSSQAVDNYADAESTRRMIPHTIGLTDAQRDYYGQLKKTGGTEAARNEMSMEGLRALRGIPVEDWSKGEHAANALAAHAPMGSSMLQADAADQGMNETQRRLAETEMTNLGWQIMNPKPGQIVTNAEIESFNRQAGIMKMPYAMAVDHKGKGIQIRMPIVAGQQLDAGQMNEMLLRKSLTIQGAVEFARSKGISVDALFKLIAEESQPDSLLTSPRTR